MVFFETTRRKPQGGGGVVSVSANASEPGAQIYYHFGHLTFEKENVALQVIKNGHAKIRDDFAASAGGDGGDQGGSKTEAGLSEKDLTLRKQFALAYQEAVNTKVGIHALKPLVRNPKSVENPKEFVQQTKEVKAVIEYIFDGSRYRCQVTNSSNPEYLHSTFTLILGGVICPRSQRPIGSNVVSLPQIVPNATPEQELVMGSKARLFVEERLLQRELSILLHGTDKSGGAVVATVQHPKGSIAAEILKNGFGRIADWSIRLMDPAIVAPLRSAENTAKESNVGVWTYWQAPQLSGASEVSGICIEVVSGDTIVVLPAGTIYDSEGALQKISLASVRSPRMGNERAGRVDEPYAWECKERLRALCAGKQVKVVVHYERDIPLAPEVTERRRFGTIAVGKRANIGEVLLQEGLANTQRHRDDDEKSPRYDELRAAEAVAKGARKGLHNEGNYKKNTIIDLTEPQKAKSYVDTLSRGGTFKAIVQFCFNGARFKMHIPSENCHIMFSPNVLRCPQPSPSAAAAKQGRKAEPFGDAARRHARLTVLQRSVEITCSGVTNGGVITGNMWVGQGAHRHDYALELVAAGLATVDQRKIDYGEVPQQLVDAQIKAQTNKIGIWSVEQAVASVTSRNSVKSQAKTAKIAISEIRNGSHFFFREVDSDNGKVVDDRMKDFTQANGTGGGPCEVKVGKVVAALFDDGTGKSWYRAKITEKIGAEEVSVLFVDHGNIATVPIATHLLPLNSSLSVDQLPPAAKEAVLALTLPRSLDSDEGIDAARMLQNLAWGKDVLCTMFGPDDSGKLAVGLNELSGGDSFSEQIVAAGLARVAKSHAAKFLSRNVADGGTITSLFATLNAAQEGARKSRLGMWRYGDVGDEDEDEF